MNSLADEYKLIRNNFIVTQLYFDEMEIKKKFVECHFLS